MEKRKATDPASGDNAKEEAPIKRSRAKYDEPPSDSEGDEGDEGDDDEEESEFEEDDFESDGGDDLDALSEPEVEPSSRRTRNRNIDYKKLSEDLDQEKGKDEDDEDDEEPESKEDDKESKEDDKEDDKE